MYQQFMLILWLYLSCIACADAVYYYFYPLDKPEEQSEEDDDILTTRYRIVYLKSGLNTRYTWSWWLYNLVPCKRSRTVSDKLADLDAIAQYHSMRQHYLFGSWRSAQRTAKVHVLERLGFDDMKRVLVYSEVVTKVLQERDYQSLAAFSPSGASTGATLGKIKNLVAHVLRTEEVEPDQMIMLNTAIHLTNLKWIETALSVMADPSNKTPFQTFQSAPKEIAIRSLWVFIGLALLSALYRKISIVTVDFLWSVALSMYTTVTSYFL